MVTIYQRTKRQQVLLIVFFGVVLITVLVWYFGEKGTQIVTPIEWEEIPQKKVEINFQILENPILKEFELYEKIEPLNLNQVGRENPFSP